MPGRPAHPIALRRPTAVGAVSTRAAPVVLAPTGAASSAHESRSAPREGIRPEIQGLRAISVLLVVAYHLWPSAVPGGYVGVDVFFAISGFLITAHLLREADRDGRVSLVGFWARRARRLLPASVTVLLFCAVATLVAVPQLYWQSFLGDIVASAGYVQNWHLAASSVDYLASAEQPSPVQHFWSLAAEEQFYLAWPALILLALALVRSGARAPRRRAILGVLGLVTAGSLAFSVLYTASDPTRAYFVTPTRAWEFGAGGLLALLAAGSASSSASIAAGRARAALSGAGLAAILVAAFAYTDATAFPGIAAALPIVGALAVMGAGMSSSRLSPTRLLARRPVQFVGDISYGIYLWHWPLLVLAPYLLGHGVGTGTRLAVLGGSVLLAWGTKLLVEDPVRASRWLAGQRPRVTFAAAAAGTVLVFAVAIGGTRAVERQIRDADAVLTRALAKRPPCFGAASHDPNRRCVNPALAKSVVPLPVAAPDEENPSCTSKSRTDGVTVCGFGVAPASAKRTFALIGDSHATHWRAGMEVVAARKRWHGLSITRTGCPFSGATYDLPEPARSRCVAWNRQVPRELAKHPEVDTVFVSSITGGDVIVSRGMTEEEAKVAGYLRAWRGLPKTVKRVVVLRDTPKSSGGTLECIDAATQAGEAPGPACRIPADKALDPDPAATAARELPRARAQVIDMTKYMCDKRECDAVIGGVLVHKDLHHLTREFSTTLGPFLVRKINSLEVNWR